MPLVLRRILWEKTGGFLEKALVCSCLLRFWHTLGLGLATIPWTAADRHLSGDRLTETVAQGGSEAAVATCGHRRRLCDAIGGRITRFHTCQPGHGERIRSGALGPGR